MKIRCSFYLHDNSELNEWNVIEEYELNDDMTRDEINGYCYYKALRHAEKYFHIVYGNHGTQFEWGWYLERLDYYWEEI